MATNAERLQQAGLVKNGNMPEPYASLVESLSDDEVSTILRVKERIDSASDVSGHSGEASAPDPDDVFNCF